MGNGFRSGVFRNREPQHQRGSRAAGSVTVPLLVAPNTAVAATADVGCAKNEGRITVPASTRVLLIDVARQFHGEVHRWFVTSTDAAFIRSEVNGRQSRRIVLVAFICTEAVGAVLWAQYCSEQHGTTDLCASLGMQSWQLVALLFPVEFALLFLDGWKPWAWWSDCLLIAVFVGRLIFLDVILWTVPLETLIGDMLWFVVLAVMCRVHSLALATLVLVQIVTVYITLCRFVDTDDPAFEFTRYGEYSCAILVIVSCAYIADEQSRIRSFGQLMSLHEQNSALSEMMLRCKVLMDSPPLLPSSSPKQSTSVPSDAAPLATDVDSGRPVSGWHHVVMEEGSLSVNSASSFNNCGARPSSTDDFRLPLPHRSSQAGRGWRDSHNLCPLVDSLRTALVDGGKLTLGVAVPTSSPKTAEAFQVAPWGLRPSLALRHGKPSPCSPPALDLRDVVE